MAATIRESIANSGGLTEQNNEATVNKQGAYTRYHSVSSAGGDTTTNYTATKRQRLISVHARYSNVPKHTGMTVKVTYQDEASFAHTFYSGPENTIDHYKSFAAEDIIIEVGNAFQIYSPPGGAGLTVRNLIIMQDV